jgi:hypothetical protein
MSENPTTAEILEEHRSSTWQLKAEIEMLKIVTRRTFELLAGILSGSIDPDLVTASIAKNRDDMLVRVESAVVESPPPIETSNRLEFEEEFHRMMIDAARKFLGA